MNVETHAQRVWSELSVRELIVRWHFKENRMHEVSVLLALEICKRLEKEKDFAELERFLKVLPKVDVYTKNENIVRATISVALEQKNFPLVYELIKVCAGPFKVKIWLYCYCASIMLHICELSCGMSAKAIDADQIQKSCAFRGR